MSSDNFNLDGFSFTPDAQEQAGYPRIYWRNGAKQAQSGGFFYASSREFAELSAPWEEVELYKDEPGFKASTLKVAVIRKRSQAFTEYLPEGSKDKIKIWHDHWKIGRQVYTEILCFMDGYDGAGYGVGGAGFNFSDPTWVKLRANMGYARTYADRMDLAAATPRSDLCSTTFCLAKTAAPGAEFLIYQPTWNTAFTVNLSGLSGSFTVEWLNPDNGSQVAGSPVSGGATRTFTAPFSGDAVLYLKQTDVPTPTATATLPAASRAALECRASTMAGV